MMRTPVLETQRRATLAKALNLALDKRRQSVAEFANWEEMRQRAHDIRAGVLERLDEYLNQFERAATANGIRVVRVATAEEACRYVVAIAKRLGVTTAVKSKSMVTEEIHLNRALEAEGIRAMETDLGEYIAQLCGQPPFHLTAPIVHLSRDEVGRILADKLGVPFTNDPTQLTLIARDVMRREFLTARLGISGANFCVAESGSLVLVTNEGNGRMCTTLPAKEGPRVHIAITGIEKVVPTLKDVAHLLRLLARSGSGLRLTAYTTLINGPRKRVAPASLPAGSEMTSDAGKDAGATTEPTGPDEVHVLLLDNGRRAMLRDPHLREALCCIRCGACSNQCPVYHRIGGHAYQSVYNGPIGSVWSPALWDSEQTASLPFDCSLCGACADICPVKIDIHHALLWQRKLAADRGYVPRWQRLAWRMWRAGMSCPILYNFGSAVARRLLSPAMLDRLGKPWTETRDLPPLAKKTFHELWKEQESGRSS